MPRRCAGIVLAAWLGLAPAAPATETLIPVDAAGLRTALDAQRGRVVLVNFWATWCRPCLEEIPVLAELESRLRDSGFRLVAVSLDEADSGDSIVRPFMDKWFPGFKSYLSLERARDEMVGTVDPAWNEVLPTSYLIARDGSVAERIQGNVAAETFDEKIRALLRQP